MAIGHGYSGSQTDFNKPAFQQLHTQGPIPQGTWLIGLFYDDPGGKGPLVARLSPGQFTDTFGRSGFMIHGDNAALNHTGSEGCIVLAHDLRQAIADSKDYDLQVVA
jgi:Protein of unknown function (DUF2778)